MDGRSEGSSADAGCSRRALWVVQIAADAATVAHRATH